MATTATQPRASSREFLPHEGKRRERTAEQMTEAVRTGFDYPATQVGVVGSITVYYDPSLGPQGLALANQMLNFVIDPYVDMEAFFGISGGSTSVIIAPLSGNNDGTGGAYHYGCDFTSAGTLYLDATFANTTAPPFSVEVALYVAELSECFMGQQNRGWGCGYSNGEALSRFCSEQTPPGTMPSWGITGPSWVQANYPNWVDTTEHSDRDYASIGCGTVYLNWMCSQGFTIPQIVQAGGSTLADNYKTLTGKTTAYNDLVAAAKAVTIKTDDPFPARAARWNLNDLTAAAKAPAASGKPDGYLFDAQGTQHVNYRDVNGHIQELWWDSSGWHNNDLTAAAKAPLAVGDPVGYLFDAQGTQHVDYRDVNGHIQELWWDSSGWHNNDLTAATNAPLATGKPDAYMFNLQGTQHVNYRDGNGRIQELWWDGSGWHLNDLTAAAKAPLAAGDPTGYIYDDQGTQHVDYRDASGHIQELWWDGSGWHNNDLTADTNAPSAASNPAGYLFFAQNTQHVVYQAAENHIHELWWG